MTHHHNIPTRMRIMSAAGLLLLAALIPLVLPQSSYAASLTSSSLTLEAVGSVEGSTPGGTVNHVIKFTMPGSGSTFQSFKLLYCTTDNIDETLCTAPTGLDISGASLGTQAGITGGTAYGATANSIVVNYASAVTPSGQLVTIPVDNAVNPTDSNTAFYVRILAYSGSNGTGTVVHSGAVAASTAEPIVLTGKMPESLIFCAGATIETTSGIPDCSTASTGNINFNQLFSPTDTAYATSQMAASTNAGSGYAISVNGPTLTSGSYTIPAMAAATTSTHGVGQFGLNLVADTSPSIAAYDNDNNASTPDVGSANVVGASGGTNLGTAATNYDTDGTFKFVTGDTVANSTGPTDAQIYTVSYIANVTGSQAPGTYVTTLQYICTPTF